VNLWTNHLGPWFSETWDKIKGFFTTTLPEKISAGLSQLYKWIVQPFVNIWTEHLGPWFSETWNKIKDFFVTTLPAKIGAGFTAVKDAIVRPFKAAYDWVKEHVIDPLTEFWDKVTGWMRNDAEKALAKAREVNAAIDSAKIAGETYLSAPGGDVGYKHALGGVFTIPHFGLVAESGPEAIVPLTNPSRAAQVMAQAGLGGNTININATVNLSANSYAGGQAAASGFLDGLRDRCAIAGVRIG
jgi:hypothetical protein